jgi:hypothetical protein
MERFRLPFYGAYPLEQTRLAELVDIEKDSIEAWQMMIQERIPTFQEYEDIAPFMKSAAFANVPSMQKRMKDSADFTTKWKHAVASHPPTPQATIADTNASPTCFCPR